MMTRSEGRDRGSESDELPFIFAYVARFGDTEVLVTPAFARELASRADEQAGAPAAGQLSAVTR